MFGTAETVETVFNTAEDTLGVLDPPAMSRPALCDATAGIARLRQQLDVLQMKVVVAVGALGDAGVGADVVLRRVGGHGARRARRVVRTAEKLEEMPLTRVALESGGMTGEHAAALAEAAEKTSAADVESSHLIDRAGEVPVDVFAKEARAWARDHTPDKGLADHAEQRKRRRFNVFDGTDGSAVLNGQGDQATVAEMRSTLDRVYDELWRLDGGRDGTPDAVRTPEQRRFDALAEVFRRATGERRGRAGSSRRDVAVVIDIETLLGREPDGRCEMLGQGRLPIEVAQRLACSGDLYALLTNAKGEVLFHGRRKRLSTVAQTRALMSQYGGCAIDTCDAAPRWCEIHHVNGFGSSDGLTNIDEMIPVCHHDHHLIHDHRYRPRHLANGNWTLDPPDGERGPP